MQFDIINTPRLQLRKITPEVYAFVFANYSHDELKTFFGLDTDEELAAERARFEGGFTTFNKSFLLFQLVVKDAGTAIGWCGFHTWYLPHRRAELGYWLTKDEHKGKGYMREALPPVLDYGFNQMNLHRIEAFVGPTNTPSMQLIRNNHFTQEGLLRQHYCKNDVIEDSAVFSLLQAEYIQRPTPPEVTGS